MMAYKAKAPSISVQLTSNTPPASVAPPHGPTPQPATRSSSRFTHDEIDELSIGSRDVAVANSNAPSSGKTPFQRASRDDTTQPPPAQLFGNLDCLTWEEKEKIIKGPDKQEILSYATKPIRERVNYLAQCYSRSGRLKQPWHKVYGAEVAKIREGMKAKPPTRSLGIKEPPRITRRLKQPPPAGVLASLAELQHPQDLCQICQTPLKVSQKGQKLCSACPKNTLTTPAANGHVVEIRNPHHKDDVPLFPNLTPQPDERKSKKRLPPNPNSCFVPDAAESQAQYGPELRATTASPITLNGSSPRHRRHENTLHAITSPAAPARRKPEASRRRGAPIPSARYRSVESNLGTEWLDDDQITGPLQRLSTLVLQYTAESCINPRSPYARVPFLDAPYIRDQGRESPLVKVLQRMLDVPVGVAIERKIQCLQLEPENSLWITSVLNFMISEFIFERGSPFEDSSVLLETLSRFGHDSSTTLEILQDYRLRTISTSPYPAEFAARLKSRRETFVTQLDNTMIDLVGSCSSIHADHNAMALIAESLNLQINAYNANYRPIWPKIGDLFSPQEHESEIMGEDKGGGEKKVLLTMLVGIKVEIPGGGWRICSPAKVRLWSSMERSMSIADSEGQRKRQHEEIS